MELLELGNLVGPESYVKERIAAFREAGVTNLQVDPGRRRRPRPGQQGQGVGVLTPAVVEPVETRIA